MKGTCMYAVRDPVKLKKSKLGSGSGGTSPSSDFLLCFFVCCFFVHFVHRGL